MRDIPGQLAEMSKFSVSLAALIVGLVLVALSYSWPKLQTNWTNENQAVLGEAAAKWHGSTDPHSGDPKEPPLARAARIEDLKQKYMVQREALISAQTAISRTSTVLYYAGIALGAAGLIGIAVAKQPIA